MLVLVGKCPTVFQALDRGVWCPGVVTTLESREVYTFENGMR